jgi:NADPH:quinone reductase-like Zn-dependent oxidoreductase
LTAHASYIAVDQGRPKVTTEDLRLLKQLAEAGQLNPVIDRRYSMDQIVEAHRYIDTGRKRETSS